MDEFLEQLADIFEVDSVKNDDELDKFECWDSLTILSIIALTSEKFGKQLSNDEIRDAKTIGGLISLINQK
jgi:acyl carrier protein